LKQVIENRARLKPIVESVFLGSQNIPLIGHRDQSSLMSKDNNENSFSLVYEDNLLLKECIILLYNLNIIIIIGLILWLQLLP